MAQTPNRSCPTCGTPVPVGQRFCSNCGTAMEGAQAGYQPPASYGQVPQNYSQFQQQQVPPYAQQSQQVPPYAQQPQQKQNPIIEALGALGLLFLFRRAGRRYGYAPGQRRQSNGCCAPIGCLVLLAILAVPTFLLIRTHSISSLSTLFKSGSNNSRLTTQPPITTVQINSKVTYASVDITILDAQQSLAFLDDDVTNTNGMLRLNIREQNTASQTAGYSYTDAAHLILPDGTSVAPVNAEQQNGPDAGVARTNWLDFPVPTNVKINQVILRLGTQSETQINVPLMANANLKQYEAKTSNPNVTAHYDSLNWTITSVSSSLSFAGRQATSGMRYVILTLKIDNPSPSDFNRYWGDYIRLKSGDTTSSPTTDTTVPLGVAAGSSGTGKAIFLMPDKSTSYTLILLGNADLQISQGSVDFQIG